MIPASRIRESLRGVAGGLPRPFWFLWTGTLVNRMGTFVVPFLAIYLTQVRGFSVMQAGLVAALYGAGSAIAGPLGGTLADHVGRRFTMVLALGVGGTGMIALGSAHRLDIIAPATFGVALVSEMYRPAMQAALADLVTSADRVRAYGLIYWVINLGFAIGLFVGGLLATVSFTLLFVGDGLTSLLFALLVWRGVPETRPAHAAHAASAPSAPSSPSISGLAGFLAPYRDPTFVRFLGLNFLLALIFMQHMTAFPLDMTAHGIPRATFGAILGLNGVIIVLVQPLLGPFLARRDRSRTLAMGTALVAVGFGLNALATTAPLYALGVCIWTIGEVGVLPVSSAVVADLAPARGRGRYQGAYGLSFGLASCLAPAAGSMVLQQAGGVALWSACLVIGLTVSAGHLALARRLRHAREARLADGAAGATPGEPAEVVSTAP